MSKSIQLKNKNNEKMYPHPYYPVGSIYLSVVNTNPSTWFGGTWELVAKGRTLVGVDTNDTDFNTVKKTGGSKTVTLNQNQIPQFCFQIPHIAYMESGYAGVTNVNLNQNGTNVAYEGKAENVGGRNSWRYSFGGGQAHINLPPYFTCYIWCRTA